jgi:RES domain-containing protein
MASRSRITTTQLETPLIAFRIADGHYPLLDGTGAALLGGRWNSPGRRVIYGALSYAGALLERLAQSGIGTVPRDQQWIEITIPAGTTVEEVMVADLPGWDAPDRQASRAFGDRWYGQRRSLVLIVPSVVGQPHEHNLLLDQEHPEFATVRATAPRPVIWDERLFGGR